MSFTALVETDCRYVCRAITQHILVCWNTKVLLWVQRFSGVRCHFCSRNVSDQPRVKCRLPLH